MKSGIYVELQQHKDRETSDTIEDAIELARQADTLGLETFCTLEHPFFPEFSINVNPLALFCTLAPQTQNIRFRTLCHTLPLHNPVVLAGEIAQADILTKGRLECGLGRGHAWVLEQAHLRLEESQSRFQESLEILLAAWSRERFSYNGKYYGYNDLQVTPKPLQKPHPPLFFVGTSGRQFRNAARLGFSVSVGGAPVPPVAFADALEVYREACREFGTTPFVSLAKPVFLAESEEQAREQAKSAVMNNLSRSFSPIRSLNRESETDKQRLWDSGYGFYAEAPFLTLLNWSYEKMLDTHCVLVGTPESVAQKVLEIDRQLGGIDELLITSQFGGITKEQAKRTQLLYMDKVIPMINEKHPTG